MNTTGTQATADAVMNSLYHPNAYYTSSRVGIMTKEYVHLPSVGMSPFAYHSQTSYWRRLLSTSARGPQQRFIETFDFFFQAVTQQAMDREDGIIPDLESYIALRRDTSGCKPCWALIEYANNLNIPDEVMEHPVILSLGQAANDLVTFSNARPSVFVCTLESHNQFTGYIFLQCRAIQGRHAQYDPRCHERARSRSPSPPC